MTSLDTHSSTSPRGEDKEAPFGFLLLQDRKPRALPPIGIEIRDLLAQRGKG
ncbi:hypothetical protein [Aureimonas jatrophae]|jgi:hypothetical protein|uniref:Uncharacterized protein n=1 Tax=Aureimonas jatrophae TaxID=1166073 RepID=A0A1H0HPK5_9HYPH|nr:hypothetical protein [Aureimonas jatrophae]MBB3950704.1 hypothetical protein [Aureimonas jatrophae]SDO21125.1 hypothetical protein SAMN05192530_104212 [Aureimonas jatrophae]